MQPYIRVITRVLMKVFPLPQLIRRGKRKEVESSPIFASLAKKMKRAGGDNFQFLRGTLPPPTFSFGKFLNKRVRSKSHRFGDTNALELHLTGLSYVFIGSKVQFMCCFEICTPEGRGREKGD